MIQPLTIERDTHFRRGGQGRRKELVTGATQAPVSRMPGRVPRLARLMALAIRFERLIQAGEVADYAELARLGHVTRARITQIMNLRLLAPDIQEQILFLPRIERGRAPMVLAQLQRIALVPDWRKQRRMWRDLLTRSGLGATSQNVP